MAIARRIRAVVASAAAVAIGPACNAISGVGDYEFPYEECIPGEIVACYSGPPSTQGIGACRAGQQVCSEDGAHLGPCEGEVAPAPVDNCVTAQDDNCDGEVATQCSGVPLWIQALGADSDDAEESQDVAVDADGQPILCGSYNSGFTLAAGVAVTDATPLTTNSLIAGLTVDGVARWGVGTEGGSAGMNDRSARGVAAGRDDGAAYVIGDDGPTLYAQKFSSQGAALWGKAFGPGQDGAVAADGPGIVVLGTSGDDINFGDQILKAQGGNDVVVAQLTAAGDPVWSRRFGSQNDQVGRSVAADAAGNVIVAGCFQISIDLGCGDVLTEPTASANSFFLARLGSDGSCIWNQAFTFGGNLVPCRPHVAVDAAGRVVFAASIESATDLGGETLQAVGGNDIVVASFAADGAHLWSKRFGDGNEQLVEDVAVDPFGNALLTGSFLGTLSFGPGDAGLEKDVVSAQPDGFVAKLDAAGQLIWSRQLVTTVAVQALGVASDAGGGVLVTGWFEGSVALGEILIETGKTDLDIFVAKLAP